MKTGIYQIRNVIDNKIYVGSSVNLRVRECEHFRSLKKGKHHSSKLQNAYHKYGKSSFVFEILEQCDRDALIETEQRYIDQLNPHYNIRKTASFHILNWRPTAELRSRMSEARKGKSYHTTEQINAIKRAHTGKVVSIDTRMKRARAVLQVDVTNGQIIAEYYSAQEAFRQTGINNIGSVLRGFQKKAGGYGWKYIDETALDLENLSKREFIKQKNRRQGREQASIKIRKAVLQIDPTTQCVVRVWDSMKEADNFFGGLHNITNAVNGKQKTAYGFCWKLQD